MQSTFNRMAALDTVDNALVAKVLKSPLFNSIFDDPAIPVDPSRVTEKNPTPDVHSYVQSNEEKANLARLAIAIAIGGGQLVCDYDGTVTRFVKNAAMSAIDPDCHEGLIRIQAQPDSSVVFLTGREVSVLRPMLSPKERIQFDDYGQKVVSRQALGDIKSATGEIVLAAGDSSARFAVMGMHGTEAKDADPKDGTTAELKPIPLTEEEQAFIAASHDVGREIERKYPGTAVQYKARNGVDLSVAFVPPDQREAAMAEAKNMLQALVEGPLNPDFEGSESGRAFSIACESSTEVCARLERLNKAWAMTGHGYLDPNKLTAFFCDSLGDEGGTDAGAAERINTDFSQGFVIHVRNDRDHCLPLPGSKQKPLATFASPSQLGKYLMFTAELKETNLRCLDAKPDHGAKRRAPAYHVSSEHHPI